MSRFSVQRVFAILFVSLGCWHCNCAELHAGDWAQFRGPNAAGLPEVDRPLPETIGPDDNLLWKTPLPPGHSSPIVHGDRVYVTAVRDAKLYTIALDRRTGNILWEALAPHEKLEVIHNVGSYAQSSPATDGERVVSFFGSCGLFCYDRDGKPLWSIPMGPFKNDYGAASSPIIVGDRVILVQDHDADSFLMSIDKRNGEIVWKTDRSEFPRNFSTPMIWNIGGKRQIVVAATLRVVGYDFDDGRELWTVRGLARIVNMTPVVGDDGTLYVAGWTPGAEESDRIKPTPFTELIEQADANRNGMLEKDEIPEGPVKQRFTLIDRDKDAVITAQEYEAMRQVFAAAQNGIMAIRPGGAGEITSTHVLWRYTKHIPYCPSPLHYRRRLFMIKEGGILTVLDAANGRLLKQDISARRWLETAKCICSARAAESLC
jgi:hypothetical protein